MRDLHIRKATLNDIEKLLAFEQGVITTELPFDPTLKREPTRYYDIEKMIESPDVELLVADLNGNIIASGYARIENAKPYNQHAQHAYLGFMYVLRDYRGMGINKKIIDALTAWSLERNITELRLDVYMENQAAIKAYERAGFSQHMLAMRKGLK